MDEEEEEEEEEEGIIGSKVQYIDFVHRFFCV